MIRLLRPALRPCHRLSTARAHRRMRFATPVALVAMFSVASIATGVASDRLSPVAIDAPTCATWTSIFPSTPPDPGVIPYGSQWPTAIYDAPRQRLIMFGGTGLDLGPPSDDLYPFVWALTLNGPPTWTQLTFTGGEPRGRYGHTAIFDAPRERMIIYGSENSGSDEVWSLSLSATPAWTQLFPSGATPAGRTDHVAVFDPVRQHMWVYGGSGGRTELFFLELTGPPVWVAVPEAGTWPPELDNLVMVYDSNRDRLVLSGQGSGGAVVTWTRDLATSTWAQLATTGDVSRISDAIYDPVGDRMIGTGQAGDVSRAHALSFAGTPTWSSIVANSPGPEQGTTAVAYDSDRAQMIVAWGGINDNQVSALKLDAELPLITRAVPAAGGTIAVDPAGACRVPGSNATLTATPSSGYAFVGWSGDATGTINPLTLTLDSAKDIVANFEQAGISSFTPSAGAAGTPVTLTGRKFSDAIRVQFGAVIATFSVASDTVINTSVPEGAPTGRILVVFPTYVSQSDSLFFTPPQCQSFNPLQGPVGHIVRITGYNLTRTTSVTFNGVMSSFEEEVSDRVLVATVPEGATSGPITVITPGGSQSFDDPFTVGPLPPTPAITSITPTAGAPGSTVTILGRALTGTATVDFNGPGPARFSVQSDSMITAIVPQFAWTGPISITSSRGLASSEAFIVSPHIEGFDPHQAPIGATVDIFGHNFSDASAVSFNGAAASFTVISDQRVSAEVPLGATEGPLLVTNPGGTTATQAPFRIGPTIAAGINLSWDDCGASGTQIKTFACDSNAGEPMTLIGSFRPPAGIQDYVGFSAQVDIVSEAGTLPDWWKHRDGLCRGKTDLAPDFSFPAGSASCADFSNGRWGAGGLAYDVGFVGPNRARLRIEGGFPVYEFDHLDPDLEYFAFKVLIQRSKATGEGSCSGCAVPMCILMNSIELFQLAIEGRYQPILSEAIDRSFVSWQSQIDGCPAITPVLAEATSIEADADRVRVVWNAPQVERARVHRREGNHAWLALTTLTPDGLHRIVYEDADVVAGRTYAYRLGIESAAGESFVGETSITLAEAASIGLNAIAFGPDGLDVSLSLAGTTPATIDIYDPGGRRRISHRLEGLAAGTHRAQIPGAHRLESGVYFARLHQGGQGVTRRFLVVR